MLPVVIATVGRRTPLRQWRVLSAGALAGATASQTQHGGQLVLHGVDGSRMSLRRSEALHLLPTLAPMVALSACRDDLAVRALVA